MKFNSFYIAIVLLIIGFNGYGQNFPPEISIVGNQVYCPGSQMSIVSSVSITDQNPEDTSLSQVFVQISEGYEFGQDNLTLIGNHPNIVAQWNQSEGSLTLLGPATFVEFSNAIESVVFQTSQTVFTQNRQFSINLGDANFLPSTGHYYFYVADTGITWSDARDAAASQTYYGLQGYLATITSEEESQLAGAQSSGTGWIGGSDEEVEGTWKWMTGPEAGQVFWQGVSNGYAPNGMFAFWNTNEPNNLNQEHYAHITDPSIGMMGSWNDLANTGSTDVNNAYHPKGYIVEFGGMPNEPNINLSASSVLIMPRVTTENLVVCGADMVSLNIQASTTDVWWFNAESSTTPIHSGLSYDVNINTTTTFWLLPVVNGCATNNTRIPLTVTINPLPDVSNITIFQCEDSVMDGISQFNLNDYYSSIVTGGLDNVEVDFFESIDLSDPIVEQQYTNLYNNQIIYALVTNTVTNCSNMAEVILSVNNAVVNTATLYTCDNFEETGFVTFDLTLAENEILNNQSSDITILGYYDSFDDALLQQNELNTDYTNTEVYNQTIYARLERNENCYSIAEIKLIVENIPNLLEDEEVYYCLNSFPESITLDGGIIDDVANNYSYLWSTGETTISIDVNEIGSYEVFVTKPLGCTNKRTITVLASSTAEDITIEVVDLSENNSLSVFVTGEGDYLYALDDEYGFYQDSSTFNGVQSGVHTVYIKDIKGDCGIVSKDISVLGFPKFFTPNGDTKNDTWQIKGFIDTSDIPVLVNIFNRYGKLMASLNSENQSWDGTHNGELMPTDDYWFIAKLLDRRTFKGHFTLKR
ncbi:T9SS type B sorting domain-containing protein [Winogradskyella litoriviva]|uniref:T9SS type B sorting domain-containing protein n=1 Tax=Winogradskyella litoriviva TaxID=1220182 RepID=A0ABX2E852_9FLAO|nr:T9SS type B sorting domain-containing protein [Winogradskyella litoriviva]NRD24688.1 T9SS type B sorting domain-containing protein [Winogradskyella litoriviva]